MRDKLACNDDFIARWSKRFAAERLAGLFSRHAGRPATTLTPKLEARILDWTVKRKPLDGSTHWTTRKLGQALGLSHMMVARVWSKHALRPHRLDRYMASRPVRCAVKRQRGTPSPSSSPSAPISSSINLAAERST